MSYQNISYHIISYCILTSSHTSIITTRTITYTLPLSLELFFIAIILIYWFTHTVYIYIRSVTCTCFLFWVLVSLHDYIPTSPPLSPCASGLWGRALLAMTCSTPLHGVPLKWRDIGDSREVYFCRSLFRYVMIYLSLPIENLRFVEICWKVKVSRF